MIFSCHGFGWRRWERITLPQECPPLNVCLIWLRWFSLVSAGNTLDNREMVPVQRIRKFSSGQSGSTSFFSTGKGSHFQIGQAEINDSHGQPTYVSCFLVEAYCNLKRQNHRDRLKLKRLVKLKFPLASKVFVITGTH